MQTRNKVLDDLSQLMTNAMGVAQGARAEAETAMKSMVDRWLADRVKQRSKPPLSRQGPARARDQRFGPFGRTEIAHNPRAPGL